MRIAIIGAGFSGCQLTLELLLAGPGRVPRSCCSTALRPSGVV